MTSEARTLIDGAQAICTLAPGTVITSMRHTIYGVRIDFAEGNPILIRADLSVEILSEFPEATC